MGLKFKMQTGGKVIGPSHEEGGIETVDQSNEPIAEIEGDERIFSVEDTEELESKSEEINEALDRDDQDLATELATVLGFRVVEMIAKQEQVNPS